MNKVLPALYPLGIVGSGQITRMLYQAALQLGVAPHVLAENTSDSAVQAAPQALIGHPNSLLPFAADCEVVTLEHERIDLGLLSAVVDRGTTVRPGIKAIRAAFDRLYQRHLLSSKGFNVPAFAEVIGPDDLLTFADQVGYPFVIKSVRSGAVDEPNVWLANDTVDALQTLGQNKHRQLMVEEYLDVVTELVVLVARRPAGSMQTYPVAEVTSDRRQCQKIQMPANVGARLTAEVVSVAQKIANLIDAVGILAVEFLVTTDGVIVNEVAARPHNAGHATIEAAVTSQFENHVRAVLDLPLGSTALLAPAVTTLNVFGHSDSFDPAGNLAEALAVDGAHIHLYGKRPRKGHKLGHVTALGESLHHTESLAARALSALVGKKPTY